MPHRMHSAWYTAVSGRVRCDLDSTAFALLWDMQQNVPFSGFALASIVTACERQRRHTCHHALGRAHGSLRPLKRGSC
ncbi:unnamed protein product [Urochloa humidicola]